ncbi:hypothetical protein QYE76_065023 [Lolium multiflorum]|uniref:Uncharacterized protein n=1 Tax=Lolium multiflorum TaxID=4521 RepID=A0AAD8S9G0_LOLMU|nr:hypothetical protein QYE76_065023 [Lolium multiflorum]
MPSYYCWTKHGERGVMMEDNDEEEEDDDGYPNSPEYDDTAEGNEDNEVEDQEAPDEPADDDLGRAIADARRECETEKERRDDPGDVEGERPRKRVPAKRKFIMMPVLIQGPKQPGNDIDVYLKPLVEELLQLWSLAGVRVWDEHKQEEFDLRAMLFVTWLPSHPDYSPTWESFFINRRERALARHEDGGPPPSNFNEAGRRLCWRDRTLQGVMAHRGPRLRYPQSQPTRALPPRFDYRDPDAGDDDDGDYDDDYGGEYYRARHEYD